MATTRLLGVVICALAVLATGCASPKAPAYSPDYAALDQLKAAKPSTIAVVKVQPTDPNAPVNRISLRGTRLDSPSGTFVKLVSWYDNEWGYSNKCLEMVKVVSK